MNQDKYVYSQLTDFLPKCVFDCLVDKYNVNKHVRFFTCWNQLSCMLFGQFTLRESLRDLMIGLDAHKSKYYHLIKEARDTSVVKDFDFNINQMSMLLILQLLTND
jgi:hypothetical protein